MVITPPPSLRHVEQKAYFGVLQICNATVSVHNKSAMFRLAMICHLRAASLSVFKSGEFVLGSPDAMPQTFLQTTNSSTAANVHTCFTLFTAQLLSASAPISGNRKQEV